MKLELKTKRRPLAAAILDDGSRLAILNTMLKINIYDLTEERPSLIRTIVLDKAPRTITLAPGAALLAAAYDTGVELYSLTNRDAVTERRVVKCDAVDHLRFSADGTMLMGTTTESKPPSTFILSCPYFNDMGSGVPPEHLLSFMWTTQIIFPTSSHDNSHGTLLHQGGSEGLNWAFTHDRVYECFRGVRTRKSVESRECVVWGRIDPPG